MSTKTNFKRIALVAVAALGMGVLNSVPSQAAVAAANLTVTATNGTTASLSQSDSRTGGTVAISWLGSVTDDSIVVTIAAKTKPTASTTYPTGYLTVTDTGTSVGAGNVFGMGRTNRAAAVADPILIDSVGAAAIRVSSTASDSFTSVKQISGANTWNALNLKVFMGLTSSNTLVAGTYVYTVTVTPDRASGGLQTADAKSVDVSIVVAAPDTVASAAYSTAVMSSSATSFVAPIPGTDSSVAVAATASSTSKAVIQVTMKSADNVGTDTAESVTVTTSIGTVGSSSGTSIGKSVTFQYPAGGPLNVFVFADGTAGTATINISTTSVTFAPKTVTFYSTTVAAIATTQALKTIGVGSSTASRTSNPNYYAPIWAKATDANGLTVRANSTGAAAVYAYSSDLTVISDSGTACAYDSTAGQALCPLTGLKDGTATITLRNLGTGQTVGAVTSSPITMRVSTATPATIKLAFDKTTYAPGERAFLTLTALDSTGKSVAPGTLAALLSSTGFTSTSSFTNLYYSGAAQTALPTSTEVVLTPYVKSISPNNFAASDEPAFVIAMNMPMGGASASVSVTGGSSVASAGRVAVTASATVTDSGAAALAAVTALATTVASLKTLITTLTNLVLKIQKKVKA